MSLTLLRRGAEICPFPLWGKVRMGVLSAILLGSAQI